MLAAGAALLADDRPFAAHEVFEEAWKTGPAAEREAWQGLAQLAVALTHDQRGNPAGARALRERAARRLAAGAVRLGLDPDALARAATGSPAGLARYLTRLTSP